MFDKIKNMFSEESRKDDTTDKKIFKSLQDNTDYLTSSFNGSADFCTRMFYLKNGSACTIFTMEGMVNKEILGQSVIGPIVKFADDEKVGEGLFDHIKDSLLFTSELVELYEFSKVFAFLMSGFAVLCVDGSERMLAIGIQGFSFRSVTEPQTEVSQRGSREGFVEPLRINMTLVRRRIKNPHLKFEQLTIGKVSKTDLCLCYLTDAVDDKILNEVKKRLNAIDIDMVMASGYLVDFLESNGDRSIFSGVGLTERPDTVCGKIAEGRIAILIDGTPSVLIVPYLFVENFQTFDDYTSRPYFATLTRWLKYLAFIISVFTPGLYVAATVFDPEIYPEQFLSLIAQSVASTPLPLMLEVLIIHFIYEIMREAGLRLPRPLGHAVSIVGALVIGETAVSAGLIGPPTLMVVALTAISSYVIPDIYAPVAILRFAFILVGGFFGMWGTGLLTCLIIVSICGKNSFGVPYAAPASPLSVFGMRDVLVRAGWKTLAKKRFLIQQTKGVNTDFDR